MVKANYQNWTVSTELLVFKDVGTCEIDRKVKANYQNWTVSTELPVFKDVATCEIECVVKVNCQNWTVSMELPVFKDVGTCVIECVVQVYNQNWTVSMELPVFKGIATCEIEFELKLYDWNWTVTIEITIYFRMLQLARSDLRLSYMTGMELLQALLLLGLTQFLTAQEILWSMVPVTWMILTPTLLCKWTLSKSSETSTSYLTFPSWIFILSSAHYEFLYK